MRCTGNGNGSTKTDTIKIVRDTTYILHDTTISYVPRPYKIEVIKDSLIFLEREPTIEDYPPMVKRWIENYNSRVYYDTTISVPYGSANIKDTLFKNRIVGRSFSLTQSIPEIKETITLREKPRVKGFIGLGLAGNIQTPLSQTEISFGLLMKNNSYYGIKGILQKEGTTLYGIEYKRLITFKKR